MVVIDEHGVHEGLNQALLDIFVHEIGVAQFVKEKSDMRFLQVEATGDLPISNRRLQINLLLC